jgi:ABC-type multidrug transport system fused ATPase/permease subunit
MIHLRSSKHNDRSQRWSILPPVRPLLGHRRRAIVALAISSALSALTEAGILAVVAQVAATIVGGATRVHAHIGPFNVDMTVGVLLAVAVVLAIIRLGLQIPISYLPARIAADVQAQLREELFDAFTRASWAVQSRDREGHLQEIMTSQILQATQGALQATTLITALCTFLILVTSALALNIEAALVVLAASVALFGLLRPLNSLGGRRARALSQAQMDYASGIGEAIRVAEETQVFGVAAAQRRRIGHLTSSARELFFHTQLLGRLIPNIYQSLIYLIIVAGLIGLYTSGSGDMASLGAVVLLLVRAGAYGQQIQGSYQYVRQAYPFVERLQEVERAYIASNQTAGALPLPKVRTLVFDSVSYAYRSGRPALYDINFEITRGETIGVVGPSGAGKSTLVQILLQLRLPDQGRYLINDVPAEQFARADWQRRVAYVPQEPRLLHASVADNIRYFRTLDDDAVERAGRLARIHDDVMGWSNRYDTIVGPRADAVSGGQQQRICLARALAAQPEVVVLDEPTSALDPRSESLIQDSLIALKNEVTLFIVAHNMSTLDICNRVMVIVDGRLEAFDAIALLQNHNSYYRSASKLPMRVSNGDSS